MTDLDGHLRLHHAIDQLCTPTRVALDRYRPEADPQTAATAAEADQQHQAAMDHHRARYQRATAAGSAGGQRAALQALITTEQLHRARQAQQQPRLTATTAEIPSLLDQLAEAVESSTGTGHGSKGVHRAPIGLAAAELLGEITRAVGYRDQPGRTLVDTVRAWAETPSADPDIAESWASRARETVTPNRTFELAGACPICRTRYVWTLDDTGRRVRRAAIQVNYASRSARCAAPNCTASWGPDYLEHLARVLIQDRKEHARDQPA